MVVTKEQTKKGVDVFVYGTKIGGESPYFPYRGALLLPHIVVERHPALLRLPDTPKR
jgi:hypothetical protein